MTGSTQTDPNDLQLISVSYNLGLTNGQKIDSKSEKNSYIESIAERVVAKVIENPNSIIALALQEHTGKKSSKQFQTLLLETINKKLSDNELTNLELKDSTETKPASFRAITKGLSDWRSWQGTFIFAPRSVTIENLTREHYRADHNQGKGGVTSTFTAKYHTEDHEQNTCHSIPMTFHGCHLSSDRKDGAYRRNLEISNMAQVFKPDTFYSFDDLVRVAKKYPYRFIVGDLNYRNTVLHPENTNTESSQDSSQRASSRSNQTESSTDSSNIGSSLENSSNSPFEENNHRQTHALASLDALGFNVIVPNDISYKKNLKIRSTSATNIQPYDVTDSDSDSDSISSDQSEVSIGESDYGKLDLMMSLGGDASKIQNNSSEYVNEANPGQINPSDHKALIATSSVKPPSGISDFNQVKNLVANELKIASENFLNDMVDEEDNRKKLVAIFHLYRSIHDIRLQEQLLELAINPSETTSKRSRFSLTPFYKTSTDNNKSTTSYKPLGKKHSIELLEKTNAYLSGKNTSDKNLTIGEFITSVNADIDSHWKNNETYSSPEINNSFSNYLYQMFSYLFSFFCDTTWKTSPEPRKTENKLRELRIKPLSGETNGINELSLYGLFAQKPKSVAVNSVTTAGPETHSNNNDNNRDNHGAETKNEAPTSCTIM